MREISDTLYSFSTLNSSENFFVEKYLTKIWNFFFEKSQFFCTLDVLFLQLLFQKGDVPLMRIFRLLVNNLLGDKLSTKER